MGTEAGERLIFSVYLAGDNNLSDEMVWSLQEMKAASSEPSVRERVRCSALFDPQGGPARRYDFGHQDSSSYSLGAAGDIGSLSVQTHVRPPTEDPVKLLTGLVRGLPKGRPVLVLSGHGSGAVGDFLNDEKPARALSIPILGRILEGKSIEVLGLDSCQMSTVEVGYEIRKSVSYLVASEGPISNTGWPYRQILTTAAAHAAASPGEIARALAESYLSFYRDYEIAGVSTDVAVSDLSRIERVAEAVSRIADVLAASLGKLALDGMEEAVELGEVEGDGMIESREVRDAIVLAHWSAQSYKCDRYSDLHDFARQLLRFSAAKSGAVWDSIRDASEGVLASVEGAVLTSGTTGPELQHSHGLSIYFPWSFRDYIPEYGNLRFAEETGWRKFLEVYLRATRRMRRYQSENLTKGNLPADAIRVPEAVAAETKDVEAGTRKDVEAGTRKGLIALLDKTCRSTMKNPPEGYYPPPGRGMKRDSSAAISAAAVVLAMTCSLDDSRPVKSIEENLDRAQTLEREGDLDAALALLEEAADSARESGEPRLIAVVLNRLSALRLRRGENGEVRALSEEALAAARRASDGASESEAIFNLGSLQYSSGRMRDALRFFESSERAASGARDQRLQARAQLYIGHAALMLEERVMAEEALGRAKKLARETGDAAGEAEATRVLGQLNSWLGNNQRALEYFEEARTLLSASSDPATEASLSNAVGQLYFDMGEIETALEHHLKALELNRAHPFRRREAATLLEVGRCYMELGRREEALNALDESLSIYRELRNPRLEADVLTAMGRLSAALGDDATALRSFEQAIELKTSVGDLRGRAFVLDEVGNLHRSAGEYEEALRGFREAARWSREADDPLFESLPLYHEALAHREAGRLEEARTAVEESIRLAETMRARVPSHGLRTSFLASVHERYSFYVDLLIQLDREHPEEGFDLLAFQASERVRARTLRESLQEATAGIREGIDPRLLETERELRSRINELAIEREHLADGPEADRVRLAIDRLAHDYDLLQSKIRTRSPRYAALLEPEPAALAEVQSLLDGETRFVAYHLGNERSFLWSATRSNHWVHELPGSEAIEALAREAYSHLKSPAASDDSALRRISRILLGPLQDFDETRLVVVADGALSYVPFAALLDPRTETGHLVSSVEIVRLPSASLAPPLRAQRAGRKHTRWAAIAADPVYGSGMSIRRLPESRREAAQIAALAPPGGVEVVSGFDARREWVERTDFEGFRFLHFATHGIVDDERPELSGIVLSLVDEKGAPLDGFLRLHDIYNLKLPVDLVVLSACETGLGKEVKGEGLIGLVRGFMYAGAPAVIASSWKVDDAATAELMTELYRGLFAGKRPPAALREAQLEVSRIRRFGSPYYWAAFELQGDWR